MLNGEQIESFPCAEWPDGSGACATEGGPARVWVQPQRRPGAEYPGPLIAVISGLITLLEVKILGLKLNMTGINIFEINMTEHW